jgi:hypothetical protein
MPSPTRGWRCSGCEETVSGTTSILDTFRPITSPLRICILGACISYLGGIVENRGSFTVPTFAKSMPRSNPGSQSLAMLSSVFMLIL